MRPRDGNAPGGGSQPWGQRGSIHCGDSGALCSGNARRAQGTAAAFACPSRPNFGLPLPARPPALGAGVSYLSGPSLPSTSSGSQRCGLEMLSGGGGSEGAPGAQDAGVQPRRAGPSLISPASQGAGRLLGRRDVAVAARADRHLGLGETERPRPEVRGACKPKAQRQKCLQGSSQFPVRVAGWSCAPAPPQRCHFKRTRAFLSEATAVLCTVGFQ